MDSSTLGPVADRSRRPDAPLSEAQQAFAEQQAEACQAAAARMEADLKERFVAGGGDPAAWESEKDGILAEARKQAALAGETRERRMNLRRYR